MINYFTYPDKQKHFTIIIPTWNNLEYMKLCVESIRKNSAFSHQIVLHINDGTDGTKKWAEQQKIDHSWSDTNVGICLAVNAAASLGTTDYIVYMNDDMYACPDWDKYLDDEIKDIGHPYFFLSGTMIEPRTTTNNCVIAPHNYGDLESSFDEAQLLKEFSNPKKEDWSGATWPPNIVHRKLWDQVGGYSIEFSPGMYSDPDFSMKLWNAGVRLFKGIGNSRVYHFQCKSTGRVKKNNGRKQFYLKWGIPSSFFYKKYLQLGKAYNGALTEPLQDFSFKKARLKAWVQRLMP